MTGNPTPDTASDREYTLPALLTPAEPTPWMQFAACRGMDPNLFFPGRGEDPGPAKAVCAGCPVRLECLDHALANGEKHGVFGGTSERERRRLRRSRPSAPRAPRPIRHGTPGGYNTHRRRGETPCDACRAAHTALTVAARRRRRSSGTEVAA